MNNRTGGIIATVVSGLLCGVPGIVLACMGLIAVVGGQSAANSADLQNTMIGAVAFLLGGAVLILIPMAVGFFSLRRRPGPAPAAPMPPSQRAAPQPVPATERPSVAPVTPPAVAPAAPSAPMAPAAPPAAMDPSAQVVYDRIMALNRPSAPYQIVDGKAQNVDLIAEWKIVDAKWYEIFAKAGLKKVFRIRMKLDPAKREVRAQDQEITVSWKSGVPSFSFEASTFKGQQTSISFGTGYAFTEELAPGQVYKYKFSTNEIKKPIQEAVEACGWKYKGIAFGKL